MIDFQTNWVIQYLNKDEPLPEIEDSLTAINTWFIKAYKGEYYDSKNKRILEWNPNKDEMFEIVMSVFTICLLNKTITYQAIIGILAGKVNCEDPLDRAKCMAEIIAIISHTGLIEIKRKWSSYIVYTDYELDDPIPDTDKHSLLCRKPMKKTENQILGCRYKQHDGETCLDHINTLNSIPLSLNIDLLVCMEEEATFELDTVEKQEQWQLFKQRSIKKYLDVATDLDNKFYLEWKYDTRGRCYSEGYYINPQGSSFKKAICQLTNKEIVKLDNPMER